MSHTTAHEPPPITHRVEIAPKTIALVLGAVAAVWILGQLRTVLTVMTVALVLVGTFDPVVAWLERRGLKRGRALVLVFAVASLAVGAVILLMVPPLVSQLVSVIENAPKQRKDIIASLGQHGWAQPLIQALDALPLDHLVTGAGAKLFSYTQDMLELMGFGISTIFLAIYLLADPPRAKGLLYAVVPRHHHVKLARILLELKSIVGGYMRGQIITSLAIAIFVFTLLTVLGADDALAIALFAGLTDIIPFVGGYVASAPVIVAVASHGRVELIVVTLLMILYQEFESRILVPRVYGRVLRLPPAVVVVALLVGGTLARILGALLALPIAAGLQMLVRQLRVDLPGESEPNQQTIDTDERATQFYEQLTEGVPAADAGQIADQLASMMKSDDVLKSDAAAAHAHPPAAADENVIHRGDD